MSKVAEAQKLKKTLVLKYPIQKPSCIEMSNVVKPDLQSML